MILKYAFFLMDPLRRGLVESLMKSATRLLMIVASKT